VSADLAALAALIDPAAEAAYRRQLGAEAWRDGWRRGYRHGYERGARLREAEWPAAVASVTACGPSLAELERRRWGPGGREHYGDPRPGDLGPGEAGRRAAASWAPYGLPADYDGRQA
jgi:hypothetical protein